jgi:hypothetical protein
VTAAAIVTAIASVVSPQAGQTTDDLPLSMRPTLSVQRVCVLDDRLYAVELAIRTTYRNAGTAPVEVVAETEIFGTAGYARKEALLNAGQQVVGIGDLVVLPAEAEGPWTPGQVRRLEPGDAFEGRTDMVVVAARPGHQPDAKDEVVQPGPGVLRIYTWIVGKRLGVPASKHAFDWHMVTGAIEPVVLPPLGAEGLCSAPRT